MSEQNRSSGTTVVVGYSPTELAEREAHAARVALAKMWAQSAPRGLRLKQLERWGIDVGLMRRADLIREKIRAGVRALDARWAIPLVRPRLKALVAT